MTHDLPFPDAPPRFVGWHKPPHGRRWHRIVEGEDRSEVFRLLHDRCQGGATIITEGNRDPNERR